MVIPNLPNITINGTGLTTAQVLVVHTAIQSLAMECQREIHTTGKKLAKSKLARIAEINKIMIPR